MAIQQSNALGTYNETGVAAAAGRKEERMEAAAQAVAELCELAESDANIPEILLSDSSLVVVEPDDRRDMPESVANITGTAPETTFVALAALVTESEQDVRIGSSQAAFRSATLPTEDLVTELGISFCRDEEDGTLRIETKQEDGLFGESPLCEGDKVLSINNEPLHKNDSKESIMQRLQSVVGQISIVVENPNGDPNLVEAMAVKPTPQAKIGLGLRSENGTLKIIRVSPEGLFAQSVLNAGDIIIEINGVSCRHISVNDASDLIQESPRTVTLLTKTQLATGVVVSRMPSSDGVWEDIEEAETAETARSNNETGNVGPPRKAATMLDVSCCAAICCLFIVLFALFPGSTK